MSEFEIILYVILGLAAVGILIPYPDWTKTKAKIDELIAEAVKSDD